MTTTLTVADVILAGFDADPTPQWDEAAILADWYEERGLEPDLVRALRWLVENEKWPWSLEEAKEEGPWRIGYYPKVDLVKGGCMPVPEWGQFPSGIRDAVFNRRKRIWFPSWRDAVTSVGSVLP